MSNYFLSVKCLYLCLMKQPLKGELTPSHALLLYPPWPQPNAVPNAPQLLSFIIISFLSLVVTIHNIVTYISIIIAPYQFCFVCEVDKQSFTLSLVLATKALFNQIFDFYFVPGKMSKFTVLVYKKS